MEQMARRPFSTVQVELNPITVNEEDVATISVSDTLSRRRKVISRTFPTNDRDL